MYITKQTLQIFVLRVIQQPDSYIYTLRLLKNKERRNNMSQQNGASSVFIMLMRAQRPSKTARFRLLWVIMVEKTIYAALREPQMLQA
jgi:hypothetical protein